MIFTKKSVITFSLIYSYNFYSLGNKNYSNSANSHKIINHTSSSDAVQDFESPFVSPFDSGWRLDLLPFFSLSGILPAILLGIL